MTYRLLVLVSGSGTLLQALLDAQATGTWRARSSPSAPIAPDIEGLARATSARACADLVTRLGDHRRPDGRIDRPAWDAALADVSPALPSRPI